MKNLFVILNLLFAVPLLIAEDYHVYHLELIKTYQVGKKPECFTISYRNEYPNGPTAMAFNAQGELFLTDPLNQRLLQLDKALTYKTEHKDVFTLNVAPHFYADANMIQYSGSNYSFFDYKEKENYKKYIAIDLDNSINKRIVGSDTDFLYYNNVVFIRLKYGSLFAIQNPTIDPEENNRNVVQYEQIKELLKNKKYENLKLDEKNRFIYNGQLWTRDYGNFLDYWKEIHKKEKMIQPSVDFTMKAIDLSKTSTWYLGKDVDGNYYWNDNYGVAVFNANGFLLDVFLPDIQKATIAPAVHPSGDIYFLDYDNHEVRISRIKRQW